MNKREKEKIIENEMIDILSGASLVHPDTMDILEFDTDGYFTTKDPYGKILARHKTFAGAIRKFFEP